MRSIISQSDEVIENTLYLYDRLLESVPYAQRLLRNGKVYAAFKINNRWMFGPSRFVGYKLNSLEEHQNDKVKHGSPTTSALVGIGDDVREGNENYELVHNAFLDFAGSLNVKLSRDRKVKRRYFVINSRPSDDRLLDNHFDRIIANMFSAVGQSGKRSITIKKIKGTDLSKEEAKKLLYNLYEAQNGYCALTGLKIKIFTKENQLLPSLDRIDSERGYYEDNLQMVCKFANFWKKDQENDEFLRLIGLIKGAKGA